MSLEKEDTKSIQINPTQTAAIAVAEQAKALVFSHYELALRRPRDIEQTRQSLLKECKRPSFAAIARYNKPIGKGITGPSIRFAEACIRLYRNVVVMTQTVFDDDERRIINVKCMDVEENVSYNQDVTVTKTVERRSIKAGDTPIKTRLNSKSEMLYILPATDDDILNKQNALVSKAIRTLGLRLIPADIIDECMEIVVETQNKQDAVDPDAAKRKMLDAFAGIGVSAADIAVYLSHPADVLTPKELADLRGIFQAIKDGELSWRDVIDKGQVQDETKPTDLKKGIARVQAKLDMSKAAPVQPAQEPGQDDEPPMTEEQKAFVAKL